MARYPSARWVPADRSGGTHDSRYPWRIVHHATVVISENAKAMYGGSGSWPHFTVGPSGTQQHYDTNVSARALKNASGGVETNRARAIQIELVKDPRDPRPVSATTQQHLYALLRWLEKTHGIPCVWPSGRPKKATHDGRDPGGHNRSVENWRTKGGHYGHCHVPENSHWDPAYTDGEWVYLNLVEGGQAEPSDPDRQGRSGLEDVTPEQDAIIRATNEAVGRMEIAVRDATTGIQVMVSEIRTLLQELRTKHQ